MTSWAYDNSIEKELKLEFLTCELEKLRESVSALNKLDNLCVFRGGIFVNIVAPLWDVAYDLIGTLYMTDTLSVRKRNRVRDELMDYLESSKYENTKDFIKYLEEVE